MSIIVTGAAGFIGSNIVRGLNARGIDDVIAVDNLSRSGKFANLVDLRIADYLEKGDFVERLRAGRVGAIEAIFHEGACSDTLEDDGHYMIENNFRYSKDLLDYCLNSKIPLLYASSAAVYGAARDFRPISENERPLNIYGYSKLLFDQVVRRALPDAGSQVAGFRYFNVYGPGEAHKGRMASVAMHQVAQLRSEGRVKLFGAHDGYGPGEQRRDFIHVDDIVATKMWFLDHRDHGGIFNLGTGVAEPFNAIAHAVINAGRAAGNERLLTLAEQQARGLIEYVDFPDALKARYQSFTQADISALRAIGCDVSFASVGEGVARYAKALGI